MSVKEHVDRSVLLRCREVYDDQFYVPGPLLSDGTVNIAALVVALYFERKPLTIIEEPERNLHPALVRQLVEMMRDASERNQLLVTTHNPELVKYTDLSDLLLVTRGESGFSSIRRPEDSSLVRSFLKEDLGLDDLYVMNLFEAEA
jgi:predicted ATPase